VLHRYILSTKTAGFVERIRQRWSFDANSLLFHDKPLFNSSIHTAAIQADNEFLARWDTFFIIKRHPQKFSTFYHPNPPYIISDQPPTDEG